MRGSHILQYKKAFSVDKRIRPSPPKFATPFLIQSSSAGEETRYESPES